MNLELDPERQYILDILWHCFNNWLSYLERLDEAVELSSGWSFFGLTDECFDPAARAFGSVKPSDVRNVSSGVEDFLSRLTGMIRGIYGLHPQFDTVFEDYCLGVREAPVAPASKGIWEYLRACEELSRMYYLSSNVDENALNLSKQVLCRVESGNRTTLTSIPQKNGGESEIVWTFATNQFAFSDFVNLPFLFFHEFLSHIHTARLFSETTPTISPFEDGWLLYAAREFYLHALWEDAVPPLGHTLVRAHYLDRAFTSLLSERRPWVPFGYEQARRFSAVVGPDFLKEITLIFALTPYDALGPTILDLHSEFIPRIRRWLQALQVLEHRGRQEHLAQLKSAANSRSAREVLSALSELTKDIAPQQPEILVDEDSRVPSARPERTKADLQAAPSPSIALKENMGWDVFICHAWEDKKDVARPLAETLRRKGLHVWYDGFTLKVGDRLRRSIDHGLARSRYGVVILSPNFFAKEWAQKELDGLVAREVLGEKVILPIWHNITADQVREYSPTLADRVAVLSDRDLEHVVEELLRVIKPASEPARPSHHTPPRVTVPEAEAVRPTVMERLQPFEPEMILIPAGEFLMGSDPRIDIDTKDDERPQHTLYLPDYYLAKTPVTNAQYAAFVQATGHRQPEHWKGGKPPRGKEDHPVVYVSWHDAVAYCRWLAEVTGKPYRLPSEAEWEKGARGSDGRFYPWGNQWDAAQCNSKEGGKEDTTPVGTYPQGASPYGLLDMAGNVWEWTRSVYKGYLYDPEDGRESYEVEALRVLRGGVFLSSLRSVRCACRFGELPYNSYKYYGFRGGVPRLPSEL